MSRPDSENSNTSATSESSTSPRAVSVCMLKGGVGKSTISINLARELAETNPGNVLLVDLDPNGHTTVNLGFEEAYRDETDLGDVILDDGKATPADVIRQTEFGVDLLPSTDRLESVEDELKSAVQPSARVRKRVVEPLLGDRYQYVVIDSPAYPGMLNNNSLVATRNLMIPVPPGAESVGGFTRTKDRLIEPLREFMDVNVLALVPNMLSSRLDQRTQDRILLERLNSEPSLARRLPPFARISEEEFDEIDAGRRPAPRPGIRDRGAFSKGLEENQPLREYAPESDQLPHLKTLARIVAYGGIDELPNAYRRDSADSIWTNE